MTIAATNRIDILDSALLRPGRFDRRITVELPDFHGRTKILAVHARGKPLEPDVDLEAIARRTPGFSGAALENLMNEAAITSARKGKTTIGWEEIDTAVDRILVGLEKKEGNEVPRQKELIAYHEAGHAIVGALVPDYDQIQKISIIPRSNGAGGLTFFAPQESRLESGMYSRHYLESQLAVALGGRIAEEIIYGEDKVTTGASNDIQQVARIARRMVREWGMSDVIGPTAVHEPEDANPFMGLLLLRKPTVWGNAVREKVNLEVERLVDNAYILAKRILNDNRKLLEHLKDVLMEQEIVSAEEFQAMLVEFNAHTVGYEVFGETEHRQHMPFKELPKAI
jgi:cell division protease FtsH